MNSITRPTLTTPPEITVLDATDLCIQELLHREWYLSAWSNLSTAIQWWMSHRSGSLETICFHLISFPDTYLKYKQRECLEIFGRVQPYLGDRCKQALITKEGSFSAAIPIKPPSILLENVDYLGIDTSLCKFAQAVQLAKKTGQGLDMSYELLQKASDQAAQFAICDFWKNHFSAQFSAIAGVQPEPVEQASFTPFPAFLKACRKIQKSLIKFSDSENSHTLNLEISRRLLALEHPPHLSIQSYHGALERLRRAFRDNLKPVREKQADLFAEFQQFFILMLNEATGILGPPPCPFDFHCIGSWGKGEGLPRSDLEFFILIENGEEYLYFLHLTKLLDVQFKSLGESDHTSFNLGFENGMVLDNGDPHCVGTVEAFVNIQENTPPEAFAQSNARMILTSLSLVCHPEGHGLFTTFVEKMEAIPTEIRQRKALACLQSGLLEYKQHWNMSFEEVLQQPITLKEKFQKFLTYFLSDLSLYFGIRHTNTLDIIDALVQSGKLTADSGILLKRAQEMLYTLCVRLHLLEKPLGPKIPLSFESLEQEDQKSLAFIYCFVIRPLYTYLDEYMGSAEFFQTPLDLAPQAVKLWKNEPTDCWDILLHLPITNHLEVYTALSQRISSLEERNLGESLRAHYLNSLPLARELAQIPNRAGYRQMMRIDEENLAHLISQITTDDPASGVKVRSAFFGELYLTLEATKALFQNNHIRKAYAKSLHNVAAYGGLHFKELPYQPLMEYAIHSLTYRIMGKVTPATTLTRFEVNGEVYPVLISETLEGDELQEETSLNLRQLTGLRLCETLTKPGDGRLSNYVVSGQQIYCIDNDISFVEPVIKEWSFDGIKKRDLRKVTFCSSLFTLPHPLDPDVLSHFCTLEPDLILNDWLQELQSREEAYASLFSENELKTLYDHDPERRFSPKILFPQGAIANLCLQFYHLQDVLRNTFFTDSHLLLRELISFHDTDKNQLGILVESQYRKALSASFAKRLETATAARQDQSMTSARAMQINYKKIPTFDEIHAKGTYSLQEATAELLLLAIRQLWQQAFIVQNRQGYTIEVDFKDLQDLERQKLMLRALQYLYNAQKQKPRSLTIRNAAALDFDVLQTLLHPDLKALDLSYCPGLIDSYLATVFTSTAYWICTRAPNLEELHLEGCSGIRFFEVSMEHLKLLNLRRCINLYRIQINCFLDELRISDCPKLESGFFPTQRNLILDWKGSNNMKYGVIKWISILDRRSRIDLTSRQRMRESDIKEFAAALKINTSITNINLHGDLGFRNRIGDAGAIALADAIRDNSFITSIDLTSNSISDEGAQALAEALKINRSIAKLHILGNQIGDAGVIALADALKVNTGITSIEIDSISDIGAIALADALKINKSITSIDLKLATIKNANLITLIESLKSNSSITDIYLSTRVIKNVGALTLAEVLKDNHSIKRFGLSNNKIGSDGTTALAEAIQVNRSITRIRLSGNTIGDSGAIALAGALQVNPSIRDIHLSINNIGNEGAIALAGALQANASITCINLSHNKIESDGAIALSKLLRFKPTITDICLSHNAIDETGAIALAEALQHNTSIVNIDLSSNKIGDSGAIALAEALQHNTSIVNIDLSSNKIGDSGAIALAEALQRNTSIVNINLSSNKIGDSGAIALAEALQRNTSIVNIDLSSNIIRKPGFLALVEVFKTNSSLIDVSLGWNPSTEHLAITYLNLESMFLPTLPLGLETIGNVVLGVKLLPITQATLKNTELLDKAFREASGGDPELISSLDSGVSLYAQDYWKYSLLHTVAQNGHAHLVRELLQRAKNPTFRHWKNEDGKTALDLARENHHQEVIDILIKPCSKD